MERALGRHKPYFELDAYRVIVEEESAEGEPVAEATVRVRVKGMLEHTAAAGNGPVNALDHALRKALEEFYPNLREMRLLDYKVRILDESKGTAAKTRVLITSGDGRETWGTVGVADNIIRRQLSIEPGSPFRLSTVLENQQRLRSIPLFSFAYVEPRVGQEQPAAVPVRCQLYSVLAGGDGREQARTLDIEPSGYVHAVATDVPPGNRGIRWEWPPVNS